MAASSATTRRRRRPRRGTVERPVSSQLYRGMFLVCSLPLLLAAFTISVPSSLPRPLLPPAFDAGTALQLARELATQFPDREPGTAGAAGAARWFAQQLSPYGLSVSVDSWRERLPGTRRVPLLRNVVAVARGAAPDAIVVMAHRDDTGAGPGADDDASGTAALVEIARAFARPQTEAQATVASPHTLVFLSSDGGAFGSLGAARFLAHSSFRGHIAAVIDLDAIAGRGPPRIELAGDRPRSPAPALVATASSRILEETGKTPEHPGFFGQLVDLAFPFTLYGQGPFVAGGVPAVTLTRAGNRPPGGFGDTASVLDQAKLASMGRAAEGLLGSLDQGLELTPSTSSAVWVGSRMLHGWAIELVFVALLVPFLATAVDLFALGRRYGVELGPAVRALGSRLAFWAFVGVVFTCFRLLGAFGSGPPRPPNPALPAVGDWPVLALFGLAAAVAAGWIVARHRLVPRRAVLPHEVLAGQTAALLALAVVALAVVATNPFALLFVLPALHVWLWLPQLQRRPAPVRLALFALGLGGPAIVLASLAWRFGLGLDAPWYLLQLVVVGYVHRTPVVIVLAGAAAASQLAAAAAGRYAPYTAGREAPRGPLRALVRAAVLLARGRRRERSLRAAA